MKFKIPTYEFTIDDSLESGVKCISIVSQPAFGSSAVFFEKQKPLFISFADKKKQIVCGLSLIPNVLIYRIDNQTGEEYNGFFSAETIEKIVNKFHDEQQGKNVNLEHNPNLNVNAYLLEDYIVNSEARVADLKAIGIEHPNIFGAWYCAYKIKDKQVFNSIINGEDTIGFSVETYLDKVLTNLNKENKNKHNMKKNYKSIKDKILALFTEIEFERALVPELAFEIEYGKIGEPVSKIITNPDGTESTEPVGQGEFVTEAGIIVVDESSNLVEIRDLPVDPSIESPEVSGTTEASIDNADFVVSGDTQTVTGDTPTVSGDTEMAVTGDTPTVGGDTQPKGLDKSLADIVGTSDGYYMIDVYVENGVVISATLVSQADLMSKQNEIDALKLEKQALEEKLKEPIGDPILDGIKPEVDFNKLSQYEKLMYKKGLTPFK